MENQEGSGEEWATALRILPVNKAAPTQHKLMLMFFKLHFIRKTLAQSGGNWLTNSLLSPSIFTYEPREIFLGKLRLR